MNAYRLWTIKDEYKTKEEVIDYLYDIDEFYTSKKEYIKNAKYYTKKVNEIFWTNYTWQHLFGDPEENDGYRYCKKHDNYYFADECCELCKEEEED